MSSVEAGSGFAFGAVLAAMLSALSAIWWRWRLRGPQWIDAPRSDRHHRDATSKAGGPTWLTGFLVGAIGIWLLRFRGVDSSRTLGADDLALAVVAAAAVLGYLLGDLDDRDRLRPLPKAILQASLVVAAWACCAVGAGPVAGPAWLWLGAALVLQLALGIFDNMDGTLAAVCAVGLCALGVIPGLRVAWVAMGATVGFLLWNRPPARLFLGNRGSSALATATATIVALSGLRSGGLPWWGMAAFAWPLFDLGFVTLRRIRAGRRPWHGGRDHTTHALARLWGSDRFVWIAVATSAGLALWIARAVR